MSDAQRRGPFALAAFRRLFAAQTISRWGDTFNSVAIIILVFQITGSGLRVAGTVAFEVLPVLLLAPLAGAVADRFPKRRVMVAADLVRAAVALVLVVGPHRLSVVYAVAFGLAAGSVFFNPASGALLPTLIDESRLVRANSALWTAAVASQIVLAPAAGALIVVAGPRAAFGINAASFLASALFLRRIPADTPATKGETSWWRTVREGLALVRRVRLVRVLAVVQVLAALSAGATSALLVVLAQRRLGLGPSGFGLLLAAIGVGAASGPLLLSRLARNAARPSFIFGAYALRGSVDLVLASTRDPVVAAGALVVYGVGTATGMVAFQSILQSRLPPEVRGRAFALFDVLWQTGRLASLAAGGAAADALGVANVYVAGGLLLLAAASVGFAGIRGADQRSIG